MQLPPSCKADMDCDSGTETVNLCADGGMKRHCCALQFSVMCEYTGEICQDSIEVAGKQFI